MTFTEYLIGKREQISWGPETTYGTGVTPTRIIGKDVVITPDWSKGWQEVVSAGADTRNINSMVKGPESLNFTMEFIVTDWVFLKYIFGASGDVNSGDYYTHTISLLNTDLSFTLQWAKRGASDIVYTLSGCTIIKGTINFTKASGPGKEGHIKVNCDCVAQSVDKGSTVTSLTNTDTPYQYRSVALTLNGSEIVEVNSGNLVFDTGINLIDSRYCNHTLDVKLGEPVPKTFRITGTANINVKDSTLFDLWDAATVVGSTNTLVFTRGSDDDCTFTFTGMYPTSPGVDGTQMDGVNNQDFNYRVVSVAPVVKDQITTY